MHGAKFFLRSWWYTLVVKKFPILYGTRRFTTVSTRTRHRSLSWARLIQSTSSNPVQYYPPMCAEVLCMVCNLDFTANIFYTFSILLGCAKAPPISSSLIWSSS
jgi:hypothetical protein